MQSVIIRLRLFLSRVSRPETYEQVSKCRHTTQDPVYRPPPWSVVRVKVKLLDSDIIFSGDTISSPLLNLLVYYFPRSLL